MKESQRFSITLKYLKDAEVVISLTFLTFSYILTVKLLASLANSEDSWAFTNGHG